MMTCSLSCSKFGGGAVCQLVIWFGDVQSLVKNLAIRASH